MINQSAENKALVEGWVDRWSQRAEAALRPLAAMGPGAAALDSVCGEFAVRLKKIGLTGVSA